MTVQPECSHVLPLVLQVNLFTGIHLLKVS